MSDREWMEQTAKYFTVDEPEYLTCKTLKDAVMLHIDRETYQSRVQGKPLVLSDVAVDCYVPHEWAIERKDEWTRWLVEMMQDRFNDDEDLAGEDGLILSDEDGQHLSAYAMEFVNKFARMADPQTCRFIGKIFLCGREVRAIAETME